MTKTLEIEADLSAHEAAQRVENRPDEPLEPVVVSGRIDTPTNLPASGFFDPDDPTQEPRIVLERVLLPRDDSSCGRCARVFRRICREIGDDEREEFKLANPIGYHEPVLDRVIIVPANIGAFTTDLTSVPRLFTWLVPRTGVHLPAAILHDGLVHRNDEEPTYIADDVIPREESDRIFRDAMRELGATWARRWLIWATVLIATLASGERRLRWWLTFAMTGGVITVCGTASTVDFVDCAEPLPWMADRPWWWELAYGGLAAVAIVTVLSMVLWGGHRRAGILFGLALALLLHVTVAVAFVTSLFGTVEATIERRFFRAGIFAVAMVAVAAPLMTIALVFC